MNKTVQKAIRVEYAVLRAPLAILDDRVLGRLGEHSKLRSSVEGALSRLDAAAARLLSSPSPASTEERASSSTEQPPAQDDADHAAAAEIPVEEVEHLAEEIQTEQEQHNLTGELAEDEELRRVQAELRAKHRVEEQTES
jgi:hypothetical protein